MIRILKSFAAKVWAGAILLLILSGALVLALRLLLPLAAEYRDQLAQELSGVMGAPVRIGRLGARLAGLSPELRLDAVEVLDPASGESRLRFREVRLRLAPLDSLLRGEPVVDLATIVGARIVLRRQADGSLLLLGPGEAPPAPTAASPPPASAEEAAPAETRFSPAPFFDEGRLRLEQSEVVWENRRLGLPPLHLVAVEAGLVNAGNRHQLDLRARLAGVGQGGLELKADFFGAPASPVDWYGDLYLKTRELPLGPLLEPLMPADSVLQGEADLELWSHWNRGRPQSVNGSVVLTRLRTITTGAEWMTLDRLGGRVDWQPEAGGWRLGVADLTLEWMGGSESEGALALRMQRLPDGGRRILAGVQRLPLEELAALARALPLAVEQRRMLADLSPRGRLESLRLTLELPGKSPPHWQASGRVTGLALQPWQRVPGVRGLDLAFAADPAHGRLTLESDDLVLDFPGLFRWPIEAERLGGSLTWQLAEDGTLELNSDELVLENRDLRTRSRLWLRLPGDGSGPVIDLQTDFTDGRAATAARYLPVGVLKPDLVHWLDRALVGGRVPSGSFILRGPPAAFPFHHREGRFQVLFGVENAILDYQEAWPRLEELDAEVMFLNEGLDIRLIDAALLESRVADTRAWIPDLDDARAVRVKGHTRGPFSDGLRLLRETPLSTHQARYVRGMTAHGDARIDLDLTIPLEHRVPYRIDGGLRWAGHDAALDIGDLGISLKRLDGLLRFTEHGIFADEIRARLWGMPLRIDVDTFAAKGKRPASTRVGVDLTLDVERLSGRFPHWLWESLHGAAAGRLLVDIEHIEDDRAALPLAYRLESGLQGIEVELPAPLHKSAQEHRPLFLAGKLPLDPQDPLQAGYGDISGTFLLSDTRDEGLVLEGAAVQCGDHHPPPAPASGFHLDGRLQRVDLAAWSDWFSDYGDFLGPSEEETVQPEQRVELDIGELTLLQGALSRVHLDMVRTPHAWEARVASDQLDGTIRFPDQPRVKPVSAQVENLRLDLTRWEGETGVETHWPDPRRAPGLYLDVKHLQVNGQPFGSLKLETVPLEEGLKIKQVKLDAPLLSLDVEGDWLGDDRSQRTRLALQAHSPDLGEALRQLKFTSALGEAEATVAAELAWKAPPVHPDLESLNGTLNLQIGKGRVLEVEPGVGRIFGLINLGALGRRLTLDFTDLFEKGYAFDSIDGRFTIADGLARIDQLVIEGPAALVEVSGSTDLVKGTYDQLATVTPEISTTLPLAGAVAGGPVVAAALLVAEQIMGKEVNKLIRYQYQVTGPWDDPRFTRIETKDGWSLSDLLKPAEKDGAGTVRPEPEKGFVH